MKIEISDKIVKQTEAFAAIYFKVIFRKTLVFFVPLGVIIQCNILPNSHILKYDVC